MAIHLLAGRCFVRQRRFAGGRGGKAERRQLPFRLERPLQRLERADRRDVPGAGLFRLRSIAGAALSYRKVDRAEPAEPAVQRHGEDPDAVLHPVYRRDGICVFHLRKAARCCSNRWNWRASRTIRASRRWSNATSRPSRQRKEAAEQYLQAKTSGDPACRHSQHGALSERAARIERRAPGRRAPGGKRFSRHQLHFSLVRDALPAGWAWWG